MKISRVYAGVSVASVAAFGIAYGAIAVTDQGEIAELPQEVNPSIATQGTPLPSSARPGLRANPTPRPTVIPQPRIRSRAS